jgi:hypothetical protein
MIDAIPGTPAAPLELVGRFHGQLISLQEFDNAEIRPRIDTTRQLEPRDFAIFASYLRSLAHVRTLIRLNDPSHFQAIAASSRTLFELAVEIYLVDRIDNGPEKYQVFSDFERLRAARRIVEFHASSKVEEPSESLGVYQRFIDDNASSIDASVQKLWAGKSNLRHWSEKDLRQRAVFLGAPFHEIYDVHYAEFSWYIHPGVGAIASLKAEVYPVICAQAYGVATRCYVETLRFVINDLRLTSVDPVIEKKLEFARLVAFSDSEEEAARLHHALVG